MTLNSKEHGPKFLDEDFHLQYFVNLEIAGSN